MLCFFLWILVIAVQSDLLFPKPYVYHLNSMSTCLRSKIDSSNYFKKKKWWMLAFRWKFNLISKREFFQCQDKSKYLFFLNKTKCISMSMTALYPNWNCILIERVRNVCLSNATFAHVTVSPYLSVIDCIEHTIDFTQRKPRQEIIIQTFSFAKVKDQPDPFSRVPFRFPFAIPRIR